MDATVDTDIKPLFIDGLDLLRQSGLHEQGLLKIEEPYLIERYNQCLKAIGIEETTLEKFSIDGMGFSPEIAAEKLNLQYLSIDGISNPFAIIISPDQRGLPVYAPYHSFDGDLMEEIFRKFHRQIADLTLRTGIYVDIDEGLSRITVPQDLLMMEWIVCRFNVIGTISRDAKRQREIVALLHKDDNWADGNLINELINNIETNGDLRYEYLEFTDLPFTDIRTFYTAAFGGVYVFRDIGADNHHVIVLENSQPSAGSGKLYNEFLISDPDLKDHLLDYNIIDFQPTYYAEKERIERVCECLFTEALYNYDEDIDMQTLTPAQMRKLVVKLIKEEKLDPQYDELHNLVRLSKRQRVLELKKSSPELQRYLLHPHRQVKGLARFVIHRLVTCMMPVNILDLYTYARDSFLKAFIGWSVNKRIWAISFLKRHYQQSYHTRILKTPQPPKP